jgi:hypothetical protein
MKPENAQLSTADLARASDDMKGTGSEKMTGQEAVIDRPAESSANRMAAAEPARKSDRERDRTTKNIGDAQQGGGSGLFPEQDAADLRVRWSDVQAGFVDEPRQAVERADALVADVMKRLAETFANERASLERQWDRGDNVTTEDLRVALQRYRSFFDRLLAV